tara:strand:+ start:1230 stop:1616 length:387 start_codon:yes stop_codon:yes gene_type:complete
MNQSEPRKTNGAASRLTALAGSIMDLHVRIALQEVDREKRRLISGGIFLATGGILMILSLIIFEILVAIWMLNKLTWDLEYIFLILASINILLAGISLRIGGKLTKGPYLPETLDGISKTTKAVLGKN